MKTFQLPLTAMLLLGLTTSAFAQDDVEARRQHNYMLYEKNRVKAELTAVWNEENPYLMAYQTLYNDDLREGIGVSKEQYQKMLELDNVELEFEDKALEEIAKLAIERKTGARGLRSIIEVTMLDVMFELPSRDDIVKCVITAETIVDKAEPKLLLADGTELKKDNEKTSA